MQSQDVHATNYTYILTISVIAAIAGLLYGFDTGVISGALQLICNTFGISDQQVVLKEVIVSSVPLGALLGAVVSSKFSNGLGRRRSIIFSSVVFIIGTCITTFAVDVHMVIAGRLLMGFAVGLSSMIVPMYLSEVAPFQIRGAVIFLFQLAITIGILSALVVNYLFESFQSWRGMFAVALIPSILLGLGMLAMPYSPRWLMLKGRESEAKAVLQKLRARDDVSIEMKDIKDSVQHQSAGFKALFSKKLFPLVIIAFGLFVFQQLSGINTIFYYARTVFSQAGFGGESGALLAAVATGATNVLATIIGVWVVDIIGRRALLFIGFIGVIICLLVLGASYLGYFGPHIEWITLGSVLAYIVFFAISLGGVPYIMMSELFPLNVRGAGMALASCAGWGFNMLVSATFLSLVHFLGKDNIGMGRAFWVYAGLSLIGFVFAYFLVPETRGCPLERIEANLYSGKRLRDLGEV
jgi:sugar porter (SP) family MFS transporter